MIEFFEILIEIVLIGGFNSSANNDDDPESSSSNTTFKPINDTNVAYDIQTIIGMMNTETVTQSWFRFLHIIGKPIDFCDVISISKSLEIARANRLLKDNENYINMTTLKLDL